MNWFDRRPVPCIWTSNHYHLFSFFDPLIRLTWRLFEAVSRFNNLNPKLKKSFIPIFWRLVLPASIWLLPRYESRNLLDIFVYLLTRLLIVTYVCALHQNPQIRGVAFISDPNLNNIICQYRPGFRRRAGWRLEGEPRLFGLAGRVEKTWSIGSRDAICYTEILGAFAHWFVKEVALYSVGMMLFLCVRLMPRRTWVFWYIMLELFLTLLSSPFLAQRANVQISCPGSWWSLPILPILTPPEEICCRRSSLEVPKEGDSSG